MLKVYHKNIDGSLKYEITTDDYREYEHGVVAYFPPMMENIDCDVVVINFIKGSTTWVADYIKDAKVVKSYVNINTPIEIRKQNEDVVIEYIDLIADIVIEDGEPKLLDLVEFKNCNMPENLKDVVYRVLRKYGLGGGLDEL